MQKRLWLLGRRCQRFAFPLSQRAYTSPGSSKFEARFLAEDQYHGRLIRVGNWAKISKQFSQSDVAQFSELSQDKNPIHLDEHYAATTKFKKCLVHGFLSGSLISAVAGLILPGPGSIYHSLSMAFKRPVFINDTVTAVVQVKAIDEAKLQVTFDTYCFNQNDQIVISGTSIAVVPKHKIIADS